MLTEIKIAVLKTLPKLGILDWSRQFLLKSGQYSPIYANWRRLRGNPMAMELAVKAGIELMEETLSFDFNQIADIPTGVTPFVSNICHMLKLPQISPHPPKLHGQGSSIDGIYQPDELVCVWDDVATTGGSIMIGINILIDGGLKVEEDVFVIMDREQGAKEALASLGYNLRSILTLSESMDYYRESDDMTEEKYLEIKEFLNFK